MKKYKLILSLLLVLLIGNSCNSTIVMQVNSTGMYPTLEEGEYVTAKTLKNTDGLNYGDIVVYYIKDLFSDGEVLTSGRLVGLPNDTIEVEHDICIINGKKNKYVLKQKNYYLEKYETFDIYEHYDLYEETFPNGKTVSIIKSDNMKEIVGKKSVVPKGMYYVMGDKRSDSYDSRFYGPISADKIVGKVVGVD